MKKRDTAYRPSVEELNQEIRRISRAKGRKRWVRALAIAIVLALGTGVVVAWQYFGLLRLAGGGMEPTLQTGDVVLYGRTSQIARGETIVFERGDAIQIKQIVATGGDVVDINDQGRVCVNGVELSEDYLSFADTDRGDISYPVTVPQGKLFALGDNRVESIDSRSGILGFVEESELLGVVRVVLWPVYRIRSL